MTQENRAKPGPKRRAAAAPRITKPRARSAAGVREIFARFEAANPEPKGELDYVNPFTLLVAVVLSAQATDVGVNKATRRLFEIADTPQKMLALGEDVVRDHVRTIGLFRTKAKNVIALCEKLIAEFGGEVPTTARRWRACRASAARRPMSCSTSPSARSPTPSTPMYSASPTGCASRPEKTCCRSSRAGEGGAGRVRPPRTSLADPARPLHLQGAAARMRALHPVRSLRLGRQAHRLIGRLTGWSWCSCR